LELILADLATIEKRFFTNGKDARSGKKEALELQPILEKLKAGLEEGKMASEIISSDEKYEKSGFKTIKIESDNK